MSDGDISVSGTSQPVIEAVAQVAEKMIPQSQVNDIVGQAKREAAERAVENYKKQNAAIHTPLMPTAPTASEAGLQRLVSEDDIKRLTGDEIKRHLSQMEKEAEERANVAAANKVVNTFKDKIAAGREKFQDFENVTSGVQLQYYPNVVMMLADHVDNSADVLYHLAQNRTKLYELESTCGHNSPDAIYEIKRLAESIKANDKVSNIKSANQPLSQNRPSNTGTDSGALSWADLRRKYKG